MSDMARARGGTNRKLLVVMDETPECERAVFYGAARARATGSSLTMVYVIEPADFQHWLGVEEVMRSEARERGEQVFAKYAEIARSRTGIEPELVIREGQPMQEIRALIEEDQDIVIIILAAGASKEGPGPLVSSIAGRDAPFPIPVTVVPATMSDDDIAALA